MTHSTIGIPKMQKNKTETLNNGNPKLSQKQLKPNPMTPNAAMTCNIPIMEVILNSTPWYYSSTTKATLALYKMNKPLKASSKIVEIYKDARENEIVRGQPIHKSEIIPGAARAPTRDQSKE